MSDELLRNTPPHSDESENALGGALLVHDGAHAVASGSVAPDDFYRPSIGTLMRVVGELEGAGNPHGPDVVREVLRDQGVLDAFGGPARLALLTSAACPKENIPFHAKRIHELGQRRIRINVAEKLRDGLFDLNQPLIELVDAAAKDLAITRTLHSEGRQPTLVCIADVEEQDVHYVFKPYIARGKFTLFEGDPGVGKTWCILAIIASITLGSVPVSCGPSSVVYLSAEDGLGDTLKKRLRLVGADLARVHVLTGWNVTEKGKTREGAVSLGDVDVLDKTLTTIKPALLVVDPIQGFLGSSVDMHRANEIRPLLTGLVKLAEKHNCGVVAIRHLAKAGAARAIYRGMGSIDFTACARSVLMAGEDPKTKKRAIVHIKSSLAPLGPSLGYELTESGFAWTGESDLTAADLNAPEALPSDDKKTACQEWLLEFLADGWKSSVQVEAAGSRQPGRFSKRTLERAKRELAGEVVAEQRGGSWGWNLAKGTDVGGLGGLGGSPSGATARLRQSAPPSSGGLAAWEEPQAATPPSLGGAPWRSEREVGLGVTPQAAQAARQSPLGGLSLGGFTLDPEEVGDVA